MACAWVLTTGLFESITEDLEGQRQTARTVVAALQSGASAGQVFELLRPLARRRPRTEREHRHPSSLLTMFANRAITWITRMDDPEWLPWFERVAQASPVALHRP